MDILGAVGNRQQKVSILPGYPGGLSSHNANDQLAADAYDSNGNTVGSGANSGASGYVYDFENRLIQQGGISIVYDGDGNRVQKIAGGITTQYFVSNINPTGYPQVLTESFSGGSGFNVEFSRTYLYGLELISQKRAFLSNGSNATQTSYYVYDGHGSTRALSDGTGAVTDTYDYDAFGNLIHSTGTTPNNYLFAGEQYDPDLHLYYNRARYLNVSTGRFWSMDTYEGDLQSPTSLHKYVQDWDDPVNHLDPSGHDLADLLTAAFVITTNIAASIPNLTLILGATFAALNIGLFITNEDYRVVVAANPDVQHALYEDVALLFNFGGEVASAVFTVAKGAQTREIVIDLFGGATSQVRGAVNIDLRAQTGIQADVADLPIRSESVDKIIASGPRAPFLKEASRVLKPGGRIYINYTARNTFGEIPDEGTLGTLRLRPISVGGPLDPQFAGQSFAFTDGTPINSSSVKTTILEKY